MVFDENASGDIFGSCTAARASTIYQFELVVNGSLLCSFEGELHRGERFATLLILGAPSRGDRFCRSKRKRNHGSLYVDSSANGPVLA